MSEIEDLQRELRRQRESAIDLSRRNRLIHLNPRVGAKALQIVDELPDAIAQRLASGRDFTFLPVEEAPGYHEPITSELGDVTEFSIPLDLPLASGKDSTPRRHSDARLQTDLLRERLEPRLRSIQSFNRTELTERGISTLFLAIGFLRYGSGDPETPDSLAPLYLIPVGLEKQRRSSGVTYCLHALGAEPRHNLSLSILLEREYGFILPDLGDDGMFPEEYFQLLENRIAQARRPWSVVRRARLDFFNYSGLAVNVDLDPASWPTGHRGISTLLQSRNVQQAVFGDLGTSEPELGSPPVYRIDQHPLGRNLVTPMPADSSQASAIIDVMEGKSLIIEGPPGTGKSQTIANLIAMELSQGKTVLFVAEKPAALQVVQKRLQRLGFGHYICYQHSATTSTSAIYERLRNRLDLPQPTISQRQVEQAMADFDRERRRIENYLNRLHAAEPPMEQSLHDLIWELSRLVDDGAVVSRLETHERLPSRDEHVERLRLFEELATTLDRAPRAHLEEWIGTPAAGYTHATRDDLQNAASRFRIASNALDDVERQLQGHLGAGLHRRDASTRHASARILESTMKASGSLDNRIASRLLSPWIPSVGSRITEACRSALASPELSTGLSETRTRDLLDTASALSQTGPWSNETAPRYAARLRTIADTGDRAFTSVNESAPSIRAERLTPADAKTVVSAARLLRKAMSAGLRSLGPGMLRKEYLKELRPVYLAAKELVESRRPLARIYDLDRLHSTAGLFAIADRAGHYEGRPLRFVSPGWYALRREIRSLTHPGAASPAAFDPRNLLELAKLSENQARFNPDALPALANIDVDLDHEQALDRLNIIARCLSAMSELDFPLGFEVISVLDLAANDHAFSSFERGVNETTRFTESFAEAISVSPDASSAHASMDGESWQEIRGRIDRLRLFAGRIDHLVSEHAELGACSMAELMAAAEGAAAWFELTILITRLDLDLPSAATDRRAFIATLCESADSIRSLESAPGVPFELLLTLDKSAWFATVRQVGELLRDRDEQWDICESAFTDMQASLGQSRTQLTNESDWTSVLRLCELVEKHSDALPTWSHVSRLAAQAEEKGIDRWAWAAIRGDRTALEAMRDYEASSLYATIHDRLSREAPLRTVTGDGLDTTRSRFRVLDEELRKLNQSKLRREAHHVELEQGENAARVGEKTQYHLVRHETQKQQRHLKLRPLFERADRVLMQLQPCWMMNPTTVAEVLPRKTGLFDLVVFDEASQIKTVHALGALARAKQFVVVGDPKQLPPTSFFDKTSSPDESTPEEELVASTDTNSVLEALARTMPSQRYRRLKWHYRSEHESLIAFSNRKFYEGDLIVFPAASDQRGELGVTHTFVEEGCFESGRNLVEATAVARAVIEHARRVQGMDHPPSLGVAAMNLSQAELIAELIDKEAEGDREAVEALRHLESLDEPLFIKNLENVQGDERDVIFISFTYGPDPASGRVMQRFGPINQAGGWKRLNVLVTRARRQVRAFTSMQARDIVAGPNSSPGVAAMRDYIAYASSGGLVERGVDSGKDFDSPFEASVARVLQRLGMEVVPQVGVAGFFIDLGVRLPGNPDFILGIECDGEMYHSARSSRDRDAIRQAVIESKGWTVHRIWSTDWFTNRQQTIARLEQAVREAAEKAAR